MTLNILFQNNNKFIKKYYFIDLSILLTQLEEQILTFVYQPILGLNTISLYRFFIIQNNFFKNNKKMLKTDIFKFCKLNQLEFEESLEFLIKYDLLIIKDFDFETSEIILKKPKFINELFQDNEFYKKLMKNISKKSFEKIYIELSKNYNQKDENLNNEKKTNFKLKIKEIKNIEMQNNTEIEINTDFLKELNYNFKIKELNLYKKLILNHNIPKNCLEIIIDYVLFRNCGKRIEVNYIIKLVEDLNNRCILFNKEKIINHFVEIYENLSINHYLVKNQKIPNWLKENSFNKKISINLSKSKKNDNNINNKIKNLVKEILYV